MIDAGIANGLTVDQRGLPRTVDQAKANATGSDGTDMGSVEVQAAGSGTGTGTGQAPGHARHRNRHRWR